MSQSLGAAMPSILRHEGVWTGVYRHLDADAMLIDQHLAVVRCEFPESGPYAYVQHNRFTWSDGRVQTSVLPGVLRDGRLWWDVETFRGSSWETDDGLLLLNLERKDDPGARFFEIIVMGGDGATRARTWHWFKDDRLFKRTLCDERHISSDPFADVEPLDA